VARLYACALFLALLFATAPAFAARQIYWKEVEVLPGEDAARVKTNLKGLLRYETKRAKWGKGKDVQLYARVTEFAWERSDDVLRIHVTVVARIAGGESARSRIRIGGHPRERKKLMRQALSIVASGLVTRLAAMARERP
jgi:hypothetical protein